MGAYVESDLELGQFENLYKEMWSALFDIREEAPDQKAAGIIISNQIISWILCVVPIPELLY